MTFELSYFNSKEFDADLSFDVQKVNDILGEDLGSTEEYLEVETQFEIKNRAFLVVGRYPFNNALSGYVKGGVSHWSMSIGNGLNDSGTSYPLGFGLEFSTNSITKFYVAFDYFDLDSKAIYEESVSVKTMSVGIRLVP